MAWWTSLWVPFPPSLPCGGPTATPTPPWQSICAHEYVHTQRPTHAHMRRHAHVLTHAHTCAHMHAHLHSHTCTLAHTHTCTRARTCALTHTLELTHMHRHTHSHTHTHSHSHTHMHGRTHSHTHTLARMHTRALTHAHSRARTRTRAHARPRPGRATGTPPPACVHGPRRCALQEERSGRGGFVVKELISRLRFVRINRELGFSTLSAARTPGPGQQTSLETTVHVGEVPGLCPHARGWAERRRPPWSWPWGTLAEGLGCPWKQTPLWAARQALIPGPTPTPRGLVSGLLQVLLSVKGSGRVQGPPARLHTGVRACARRVDARSESPGAGSRSWPALSSASPVADGPSRPPVRGKVEPSPATR